MSGNESVHFDPSAFVADPELLSALERRSIPFPCETSRILFRQGELAAGLYILHSGHATLTIYAEETPVMSVETGPGALLGLPGIVGNQPYSMTAEAQQGAEIRFISRTDFIHLMQSDPQISFKVLQVLAAEVRTARRALY